MKATRFPRSDRRTAHRTGNQADRSVRMLLSVVGPKSHAEPHPGDARFVEMQGVNSRHPVKFLIQHEYARMRMPVLTFDFATPRHIGLTRQQEQMKRAALARDRHCVLSRQGTAGDNRQEECEANLECHIHNHWFLCADESRLTKTIWVKSSCFSATRERDGPGMRRHHLWSRCTPQLRNEGKTTFRFLHPLTLPSPHWGEGTRRSSFSLVPTQPILRREDGCRISCRTMQYIR